MHDADLDAEVRVWAAVRAFEAAVALLLLSQRVPVAIATPIIHMRIAPARVLAPTWRPLRAL